jgi:hypothetical protein
MRSGLFSIVQTKNVDHYHTGRRFLHWQLTPAFRAACKEALDTGSYFFFSMQVIRRGAWPALSHVGRAVYLGAGLLASVHRNIDDDWIISDEIKEGVSRDDIRAAAHVAANKNGGSGEVRLAYTSIKRLAETCGLNAESVGRFLKSVRPVDAQDSKLCASCRRILNAMPLWAYPTNRHQGVVVHFRDHVSIDFPRISHEQRQDACSCSASNCSKRIFEAAR